MRRTVLAASTAALALVPASSASAATACTGISKPRAAAKALYGAGVELVRTQRIAGLRTALVLEPRISPGTRRRMIGTESGWCDAATGFNRGWRRADEGAAAAAAFASVAAAPYFDRVKVTDIRRTAPGAYVVRTHARTNGVEARWLISTDRQGIRSATWTATRFAVKPFAGQLEGLTALPGASETYTAVGSGLLTELRGLPTAAGARRASTGQPSVPAVYTGPDGMHIRLSIGDTRVAIDPGMRTGIDRADVQQDFMEAIRVNYEEFHDWGLRKGWVSDFDPLLGPDVGWVYINDALSLYCLACVFIADDFQIHMISEINAALAALGFDGYKDPRKAFTNVVGHEMFHNFQNAYNKPGALGRSRRRSVSTAYSEGTARFQETLHSYSDVSFADKTLVTGGQPNPPGLSLDRNHCNGYQERNVDDAFAAGPFPKTYNACYFWTSWYNQNGAESFIRLITEAIPAHATKPSLQEGVAAIAAAAPDVSVAEQLAFFAGSALTGRDRTIAPLSGDLAPQNWGAFFFKWDPAVLESGAQESKSVNPGGVFARRLTKTADLSLQGDGLVLYVVRANGDKSSTKALPAGPTTVDVPASARHTVWVVAVNPTAAAVTATLGAQ